MLYRSSKFDTHTNQFLQISSFLFFLRIFIGISVRPRPHVAGYFRKRITFSPNMAIIHTKPAFSGTENGGFRMRSPGGDF